MKKVLIGCLLVASIAIMMFITTNPSLRQFKDYIGERKWKGFSFTYKRVQNNFFYSVYEFSYTLETQKSNIERVGERQQILASATGTYKGVFMNFYKLK